MIGLRRASFAVGLFVSLLAGVGARAQDAEEGPRATPRAAVVGFLEAAADGDYAAAARYLDLRPIPKQRRATEGPRLARELQVVLDQKLWVDVEALSEEPGGDPDDGMAPRMDLVGELPLGTEIVPVLVERGRDGEWRIATQTVSNVGALYAEHGYGPLGQYIPAPLFQIRFLYLELWQWIGLIAGVVVSWVIALVLSLMVTRLAGRLTAGTETELDDKLVKAAATPLTVTLALALFYPVILPLGLAVPARETIAGLCRGLIVATIAWLAMRLVDLGTELVRARWESSGRGASASLLPMARRLTKVFLVGIATLSVLDNLGYDVTTLVAGLGIGGLAVALAAQKSFENFFGSLELGVDRPVAVGDFCRFGDQVGTVEDVGLRSVRIRTLDRTVVSVPNSAFASMQLENYAVRDRIRFVTTIGLRYETTAEQLRFALVELRKLLVGHPRVSPDPARVRFVSFGSSSLDLEIFAYVETRDWNEFLAIREDLMLRIMDVVEQAGSGFAFPSQTLYLGRDGGLDAARSRGAEEQVQRWREAGELGVPDPTPDALAALGDTLDYPPRGSATAKAETTR